MSRKKKRKTRRSTKVDQKRSNVIVISDDDSDEVHNSNETRSFKKSSKKRTQKSTVPRYLMEFRRALLEENILTVQNLISFCAILNPRQIGYQEYISTTKSRGKKKQTALSESEYYLNFSFPPNPSSNISKQKQERDYLQEARVNMFKQRYLKLLRNKKIVALKSFLKNMFKEKTGEYKPRLKEEIVQWIFAMSLDTISEHSKRKLENDFLNEETLRDLMFFNFNLKDTCGQEVDITIPRDVMGVIMEYYFEQTREVLNTLGIVNSKFYLLCLSLWRSIKITSNNLFKIPILVLQSVTKVRLFNDRKFNVSGYKHLCEHCQNNVIHLEFNSKHKDLRFFRFIKRSSSKVVLKVLQKLTVNSIHVCVKEFGIGKSIVPVLKIFEVKGVVGYGDSSKNISKEAARFFNGIEEIEITDSVNYPNCNKMLQFFSKFRVKKLTVIDTLDCWCIISKPNLYKHLEKLVFSYRSGTVNQYKDFLKKQTKIKHLKIVDRGGLVVRNGRATSFSKVMDIVSCISNRLESLEVEFQHCKFAVNTIEIGGRFSRKMFINRIGHGVSTFLKKDYPKLNYLNFSLKLVNISDYISEHKMSSEVIINERGDLKKLNLLSSILVLMEEDHLLEEPEEEEEEIPEFNFDFGGFNNFDFGGFAFGDDEDEEDDFHEGYELSDSFPFMQGGCVIQ